MKPLTPITTKLAGWFLAGVASALLVLPQCTIEGAQPAHGDVQKLTGVLKSQAGQKEKADACRELARIADRGAIATLVALLPDESLSHMARYALETIPDADVDKAFRAALGQLQGRPLVGVIGSIGFRRDAKAVKPLSRLLANADADVSQAAARALGSIGNSAAATTLQKALPSTPAGNQLAFSEGLLRCAERLAASGNSKKAVAIYDSLRRSTAGHQVRTAALRGSILSRKKDGLPLLAESLASADYAVFAAAARTSLEIPGDAATGLLTSELGKPAPDRQILLTQILARRGDPAGVPALVTVAKSSPQPVRLAAIKAIAELGNPSALPSLLELMGADDREVSQAAQEAVAALPGTEADAAVLAMLRGGDENRRATGMDLVVRRRMTSALPDLFKAASGPDAKLRVNAVRRIADLGGPAQVAGMLELLTRAGTAEDLEATEQALGTVALKSTDRDSSAQTLSAALATAQTAQKCALVRVLGGVGGPTALKAVRAAVKDPTPEVRTAAIRALGDWNNAEAAPDLLDLARNATDSKEKVLLLRSYLGLASQSDLQLKDRLAMCREAASLVQTPDETKLLLAALGGIRSPDSLALILPHLDASSTKEEAVAACLAVASKLLEGDDAARNASAVIEPLQKLLQVAPDSDAAKKAQALVEKAQGLKR